MSTKKPQAPARRAAKAPAAKAPAAKAPAAKGPVAKAPAAKAPTTKVRGAKVPAARVPAAEPVTEATAEAVTESVRAVVAPEVEAAAEALAPEFAEFGALDMAGFGESLISATGRAFSRPGDLASAITSFSESMWKIGPAAAALWLGAAAGPPVSGRPDRRFADPAWAGNPLFFAIQRAYQAAAKLTTDVLAAGQGDAVQDAKAQMAASFMVDALAPTNFLLTNPAALKRAFETGGTSVVAGALNFFSDLTTNGGMPRQVDTRPFKLGVNMAATPGKVVFRNELMELIQYGPQTPEVRAVPLLASPPWINKYYIMDLSPGRSFLEWAIKHNRTVFAISYRNPDASMRDVTLDDYLISGPRQALDVIQDITAAPKIDIVGLCLGGALTGMQAAYMAGTGDDRIGSITLLNTLLDYAHPGVLGAFTDARTVARLERQMASTGYLDSNQMRTTFDMLRANDLIFSYVVSGWLMGQDPPAFDILAWNSDGTRLPAAMHSFYLHCLYMRNELARGVMELAGQRLSLSDVKNDTYVVGAVNDHIVPWQSSYRATRLLGGEVRYVLSSGGHIAGIVNPPGPKAWFEVADSYPADAVAWRAGAARQDSSWWQDWADWSGQRAGPLAAAPPMGSDSFPPLSEAPGDYVRSD
jgi:polyhydroxyalkanoate synthase